MEMMKAAVYYNNKDIRIEEVPIPEIGPRDLLIKTVACGLCGAEAMEWYHAPRGPKVMGHEPAGIVAETGKDVTSFKVGDRVVFNHYVGRMQSPESLRGHYTVDKYYKKATIKPGGMCEYFRLPAEIVNKDTHLIPDGIPFGNTTILEPWGCVVGGLKVSGILPGDTVVVVGGGFMGQGFVHIAPLFGAGKVVAIDFSDYRLEKALEVGATHTINPLNEDSVEKLLEINAGHLADVVILTAPNLKALESAYALLGPGATLHLNAPTPTGEKWTFSPGDLYFKELSITTKYSADHFDTNQILRWLEAGRIDPEKVITHRFPLEEISTAFDLLVQADKSLKSVIYPNGMDQL